MLRKLIAFCYCLLLASPLPSLLADESSFNQKRIDPAGIRGSLVICGGGSLPEAILERFMQLAGEKSARLVLIPTAAEDSGFADREKLIAEWNKYSPAAIDVLHTRSQEEANRDEFVAPLKQATAVWFGGGQQSRIAEAYVGTAVERELMALLDRGGVIGGTSAGAAIQSRLMIAGGNPVARTGIGFDFLPQAVVDQHFLQRNRKPRLVRVLSEHPGHVGFGVDESTALIVRHRHLEVVGDNVVTVCLAESDSRPAKEFELKAGETADLTALRRAARDRTGPPFPSKSARRVEVANGSLFIAGGGRLPLEHMKRFVELAGGPEALIVVLPTAIEPADGASERRLLELAGAKNLTVLPGRSRSEVESEESLSALRRAQGIWFGGGRQWRFVDAYEGTKAVELFHEVLRRGGVIGGSSAGASIQAEFMVRGSPLGNQEMMAEGYERGFEFLPGAAVDQHFTQRNRHADMEGVMKAHPQLLGIGIDESTAILVRGEIADVIGKNSVFFFDRSNDSAEQPSIKVNAGERFNLVTRKTLP
jgi:cyanophycinase